MIRVPPELTQFKQWVLWKRVNVNGRTAKLPISAWSGKAAACDKPETWTTFRHACYAVRKYSADGIGFVFTPDDPFCGIDLDHCRDAGGKLTAQAHEIVSKLNSYTELSPSGNGLHIIVKAEITGSGRRAQGLETYSSGRYFTITGQHLPEMPLHVEERQQEVDEIVGRHFTAEQPQSEAKTARAPIEYRSDAELIRRALQARSGARFNKLWNGDVSDYDGDHSRADAALCRMLSYWTRGDATQIDRLFRLSGLMREKWNRKTGDETYGTRTIRLSLRS
jgi:primase-polymerase (primpol)-like protein